MRKRLKYNLDSGKKTPEEIEHNVAETLILCPYPADVSLCDTIEFQVIYFLKQWKKKHNRLLSAEDEKEQKPQRKTSWQNGSKEK